MATLIMVGACAGEPVVKVTFVEKGRSGHWDDKVRAKLDEIKQSQDKKDLTNNLKHVMEGTRHYSVREYLENFSAVEAEDDDDYEVGGDDVISIIVYEEEDLSLDAVRVSMEGEISFPLIGRILVGGLTTAEIENRIAEKLAAGKYLWDAHVAVRVIDYNSKRFLVLGAVTHPGSYTLNGREHVLDAISRAGGIGKGHSGDQFHGAGRKGKIIRTVYPQTDREQKIVITVDLYGLLQGGDQTSNILLQDRDVLYIPPAENFYIIGQVKSPKSYILPGRDLSLVEAISMAGGFTDIAARNRTRIIRVDDGVEKIIEVRVDDITRAGKKIQDVIIQPNDVIVVPLSFF